MKVYVTYWADWEEYTLHKIFSNRKEAEIYATEHNLYIEEYELADGIYNVDEYNVTYFTIFYNPCRRDPISNVVKHVSNKAPEEGKIVHWGDNNHLKQFNVVADSEMEACEKFYDIFKIETDKYYIENNVLNQQGQIKVWHKPRGRTKRYEKANYI